MSRALAFVVCACLAVATAQAQEEQKAYIGEQQDLHVYLLIGQSNMAGRAPIEEEEQGEIKRCLLLNNNDAWEPATNPLNRYSTIRKGLGMQKLNPGYTFSRYMLDQDKDITLGLIVNAKGGSKIEEWQRGTKFYKEALRRVAQARKTGTLKGILWHQGESNSDKPEEYLEKLTKLIADLREDLDTPELPFVAGQIKEGDAINDEIAKLPSAVAHTGVASSKGLTTQDRWHFDAKSMKTLGQRYGEQMHQLLNASADRKEREGSER